MKCVIENYSENRQRGFLKKIRHLRSGFEKHPALQNYRECPFCRVEKDIFTARRKDRILGWAALIFESGLSRAILDLFVFPPFRRSGIGKALLAKAVYRAEELCAGKIHVPVIEGNKPGKYFLQQHNFAPVKIFLEMETKAFLQNFFLPEDMTVQSSYFSEAQRLADIQNRIFKGSWGFNPNSAEDIRFYKMTMGSAWEDILWLKINGKTAGYIWTCPPGDSRKDNTGRIHMLGLLKESRGKGLARILISAGLSHLAGRGANAVRLAVDEDNQPALKLYRRLGFRTVHRIVWYEKAFPLSSRTE